MCGIFYFDLCSGRKISLALLKTLQTSFATMMHRGPDKSIFMNDRTRVFGFHRLAINGHTPESDQPFFLKNCRLICNGEIYNFRKLIEKYGLQDDYVSGSDCEIIIHLYRKIGIMETLKALDGVFAFVLYDYTQERVIVARDPVGVRSLFIGATKVPYNKNDTDNTSNSTADVRQHDYCCHLTISSEMKAMKTCTAVAQFPAGCFMMYERDIMYSDKRALFYSYYEAAKITVQDNCEENYCLARHIKSIVVDYKYRISDPTVDDDTGQRKYIPEATIESNICKNIRELFIKAVSKRLMSERPVGCLLSGGLDSSVTTALVLSMLRDAKQAVGEKMSDDPVHLNTYSIGLEGSVDLYWARKVAAYLGTTHHEVVVSEAQFLDAIQETIYQTESYCTTTIRASVGNYLVSKYIYKATDDVVIYCGDMSDEIFGSYRGFLKAPADDDFHRENERMIRDVRFFDLLRSDKSISGAGLEARVPFADKTFLNYVMSIPPRFKRFDDARIEKHLFRKAFDGVLPSDILWRRKEAFSDGVSGHDRTWVQIIKEFVDYHVSDDEYQLEASKYIHNPPYDKESYYYRKLFETMYPGRADVIPYYWRHPFCDGVKDPSARLLDFYKAE